MIGGRVVWRRRQRHRQQREAAGDQFQAEQHDHDEADRKDQRADERLAGLHRRAECQAGGEPQQGAGEAASDQQVQRAEPRLGGAGLDHAGDDVGGLNAVHDGLPRGCWLADEATDMPVLARHGALQQIPWFPATAEMPKPGANYFQSITDFGVN